MQNTTLEVGIGKNHGQYSTQTLALRQASEESACFLLSFFCDD